jgi:hypothetical protein
VDVAYVSVLLYWIAASLQDENPWIRTYFPEGAGYELDDRGIEIGFSVGTRDISLLSVSKPALRPSHSST